ncbi:beta/gamma crystallin family protein, partial [Klebsiella pneumoniae]|uniref:beta/gamma crystallin-related protein n=1 Tax=Klebsiella pneumoniae TaxID=573 RepID=UPI00210D6335
QRVDGEVPNLANTGFNDRISSMQLRGRWEVCTDAYFRGYCQIVDGDVRNLGNSGLNDRISSMRPVRGGGRW